MTARQVRIGILGGGFMGRRYLEACRRVPGAVVTALYTRSAATAAALRSEYGDDMVVTERGQVYDRRPDLVLVGLPNALHCEAVLEAAAHRTHVAVEKPLCLALDEADRMIAACRRAGVFLGYAENLCFSPRYERLRRLVGDGAVGPLYELKQAAQHFGPHSAWFTDPSLSGGGTLLDMGSHSIGWFRWVLGGAEGRPLPAESVLCHLGQVAHPEWPDLEDHAITVVRFAGGVVALAENSWARRGGMENRAEAVGRDGVVTVDLSHGDGMVYSAPGYGGAAEKDERTRGWTFLFADELESGGVVAEVAHFVACAKEGRRPLQTGEDGRAVLEILLAAYRSAATGKGCAVRVEAPATLRPTDLLRIWAKPRRGTTAGDADGGGAN